MLIEFIDLVILSYLFLLNLFSFRCATTVETFPSAPAYEVQPELQKMRVLVGAPLRRPPKNQINLDSFMHVFPSIGSETNCLNRENNLGLFNGEKSLRPEGLRDFFVFCTSDFTTVCKEVHVRTRRVRLLGLEVLIFCLFSVVKH